MKLEKAVVLAVLAATVLLAAAAGRQLNTSQPTAIDVSDRDFAREWSGPSSRHPSTLAHNPAANPPSKSVRPAGAVQGQNEAARTRNPAHDAFPFLGFFDEEPGELRAPDDAAPIEDHDLDADRIAQRIIEEELPDATPDERAIWLDQLRGLSEAQMRNILRLRRDFGSSLSPHITLPTPLFDAKILSPPPAAAEPNFEPVPQEFRDLPVLDLDAASVDSSLAALDAAREVLLNNIANAQTPAFKRARPLLTDLPQIPPAENGSPGDRPSHLMAGVQFVAAVRDHRPGPLKKTGDPLDLAIIGEGYFQIQTASGLRYTRVARLAINAARQLALACAATPYPVEPAITVPEGAAAISVSRKGIVSVRTAATPGLEEVGSLVLARFINPSRLAAIGEGLFAATNASGPPVLSAPGTDGAGEICQAFIEESNVDLRVESLALDEIDRQIALLLRARFPNLTYSNPLPESAPAEVVLPRIARPLPSERR